MKKLLLFLLSLAASISLSFAQIDARRVIADNPELSGGIYTSYHYDSSADAPAPQGYEPVYISHYGRHGSRWHSSARLYDTSLDVFAAAAEHNALTPLGRDVYERLKIIKADSEGREGQLTPKGRDEHRGIAERMFRNYPEVFSTADGRPCLIEARSTLVPRCLMSMAAFCERLKELNPDVDITRSIGERYLPHLANFEALNGSGKSARALAAEYAEKHVDGKRLIESLFDAEYAAENIDTRKIAQNLHMMAAGIQDVDYLGITLFDIFTDEELFTLWSCDNISRYLTMGPSADFGDAIIADARPVLRHIIEDADQMMTTGERAAFLRFAHDVNIVPFLGLLEIENLRPRVGADDLESLADRWFSSHITPMATNVQFIFFRSPSSDDTLVKVLHNEAPALLPLPRDLYPYYRWDDFKAYYLPKTE